MQTIALTTSAPRRRARFSGSVLSAGLAVIAADWLFYDRPIGVSAVVFMVLIAGVSLVNAPVRVPRRRLAAATGLLVLSMLPVLEQATWLALLFGATGVAGFASMVVGSVPENAQGLVLFMARLLTSGPFQLIRAARQLRLAGRRFRCRHSVLGAVLPWVLPVGMSVVFLLLFRSANPMIEEWMDALSPDLSAGTFDAARFGFWLLALVAVWPFMRPKHPPAFLPTGSPPLTRTQARLSAGQSEALFGVRSTVRALALFNALFLLQTALDVAYLWGGAALPEGMSYAEYAHRGAYLLVATALIAAGVILVAMRPGSPTERDRRVRVLVYLWTGQNVLLVASSLFRLQIYVAEYALTYLRVAAFVWMGLVAAGLVLIVIRIVLRKTNGWLIAANILTLTGTLYVYAFVNFPYAIAAFNLSHANRAAPTAADVTYICGLGEHAYPAVDQFVPAHTGERVRYIACMGKHLTEFLSDADDWRGWGFRNQRLQNFLNHPPDDRAASTAAAAG